MIGLSAIDPAWLEAHTSARKSLMRARIGGTKAIRIDRESLLQLGRFKSWTTW